MARIRSIRPGSDKQVIEYPGFRGGYVSALALHELADDQFGYGKNVELDVTGKARKRGGWARLISTSLGAGGPKGMYEFLDNAGNAWLLLAHTTNLYRLNDAKTAWKRIEVALRGPVGVTAALNAVAGGAQFAVNDHYVYAVLPATAAHGPPEDGEPAEIVDVQQPAAVEQIVITWRELRFRNGGYYVYRFHTTRGWERLGGVVNALTLTDTGALAVAAEIPPLLPLNRYGVFVDASAVTELNFTTFKNNAIIADGQMLLRYGQYGIDVLPEPFQDFESTVPETYLFTAVGGATFAYSTASAYTGTKSMLVTFTANNDEMQTRWPIRRATFFSAPTWYGLLAANEIFRVQGRCLLVPGSNLNTFTVKFEVLNTAGAVVYTASSASISPKAGLWSQFDSAFSYTGTDGASIRVSLHYALGTTMAFYLDDFHVLMDAAEIVRPYVPTPAEVLNPGDNLLLSGSNPVWGCRRLTGFSNHLWLTDDPADATYSYFSDLMAYDYIPAPYTARVETSRDDRVVALMEHRDRLVLWTRDSFQRISGTGPADWVWAMVNDKIGCIAPHSPAGVDNAIVWVARDGIYRAKTVDGIQNYLDVERVSEPVQPTFGLLTASQNAYGVYHNDQYRLTFPDGGKIPVSAGVSQAVSYLGLRWYKPGVLRESGIWTAPDDIAVPLKYQVSGRDGTLYATHASQGLVYKYVPDTYNDDGVAIGFVAQKYLSFGDSSRDKVLYTARVQSQREWGVDRTLDLAIATPSTSQSATLTIPQMGTTEQTRGLTTSWQEADFVLDGPFFIATFQNAVLNKGIDVQALGLIFRALRG